MTPQRHRTGGFTLLEIAVALAVLGVGVVTCLQIFSGSLRLQDRASRESRAVLAARAAMDHLISERDEELAVHNECRPTSAEGFKVCEKVWDCGPSDGVDKKDLDMDSGVIMRCLHVDVTWQDGVGAKTFGVDSMRSVSEAP